MFSGLASGLEFSYTHSKASTALSMKAISPTPIPTNVAPGATPFFAPAEASPFPPTVPAQCVPCPLDVSEFSASIQVLLALSNL